MPKVLQAVTHIWAPNAYIISFKLETDPDILEQKAKDALIKYKHHVSMNSKLLQNKFNALQLINN